MGLYDQVRAAINSASVDVQRITGTNATAAARLCNFVTSKWDLQYGHKHYLQTEFKAALQNFESPWVEIIGYASRKGSSSGNLKLSLERMRAVGLFIADMGKSCEFVKSVGVGDVESGQDASNNDGYYRAVEVYAYGTKPPVRPELPPEIIKKVDNVFALRLFSSGSIGFGPLQTDVYSFEIGNVTRRIASKFVYTGAGLTVPVPIVPPVSVSEVGPWSFFLTDRPTPLSTFQAFGNITSEPGATLDKHSLHGNMYLEFLNLSDNDGDVRVKASPIKFGGGAGFAPPSAGAVTGGRFTMIGDLFRFTPKD